MPLDFPRIGTLKAYYVYVYRDPRAGKEECPIYVGKSSSRRHRAPTHWRRGTHNTIFQGILDKIREEALIPILEIAGWFDTESECLEYEKTLISLYGRRKYSEGTLANFTLGGGGMSGWRNPNKGIPRPDYVKRKISDKLKGVPLSDETKIKIGIAGRGRKRSRESVEQGAAKRRGKTLSPETVEKMRVAMTGKRHTPEARAKMSASHKGKSHNGGPNISRALKGKPKSEAARVALSAGQYRRWAKVREANNSNQMRLL